MQLFIDEVQNKYPTAQPWDIYYFILKYSKSHKDTPSTRIISDELEISMTAVQRHLRQFEDDGLIVFHGTGSHRTYELIGVKKNETV